MIQQTTFSYDELYDAFTHRSQDSISQYCKKAEQETLSPQQMTFLQYILKEMSITPSELLKLKFLNYRNASLIPGMKFIMASINPQNFEMFKNHEGKVSLSLEQEKIFLDPKFLYFYHRQIFPVILAAEQIFVPIHVRRTNLETLITNSKLNREARVSFFLQWCEKNLELTFYHALKLSNDDFSFFVQRLDERKLLNKLITIALSSGTGIKKFVQRYMLYGKDQLSNELLDGVCFSCRFEHILLLLNYGLKPPSKEAFLAPNHYRYCCLNLNQNGNEMYLKVAKYLDFTFPNPTMCWVFFPNGESVKTNKGALDLLFKDSELIQTLLLDQSFVDVESSSDEINADIECYLLGDLKIHKGKLSDFPAIMKLFTPETFQVLVNFYDGKKHMIGEINRKFAAYDYIIRYLDLKSFILKDGVYQLYE